jgi:hypothetical protein
MYITANIRFLERWRHCFYYDSGTRFDNMARYRLIQTDNNHYVRTPPLLGSTFGVRIPIQTHALTDILRKFTLFVSSHSQEAIVISVY